MTSATLCRGPQLPLALQHMRAIKAWADSCDAEASVDLRSFELDIKARNRYYTLKPRFNPGPGENIARCHARAGDLTGFAGWLPYDALHWDLAQDKLAFKRFVAGAGLKSPAAWTTHAEVRGPFLVKRSRPCAAYQTTGPFRHPDDGPAVGCGVNGGGRSDIDFAEQFVTGANLKVWFWGRKPFFAQVYPYPRVTGDGSSSLRKLVDGWMARAGITPDKLAGQPGIAASLRFQQLAPEHVPEQGRELWIDFRYRRVPAQGLQQGEWAASGIGLAGLPGKARQQIAQMGQSAAAECRRRFRAPMLYSVDAVLDEAGEVWWLGIDPDPAVPCDAYPLVLMSLFGPGAVA